MKTSITELFGIEKPIVLPGMSWISVPELVAAVSNAGGLGILATGPLSKEQTRQAIRKIRELTDKPFGIGVTLMMPGAKENAKVALEEQVPVINFSLGKGDWIVKAAKQYGGKVIATVVTQKHALAAQKSGVDALLVTGHEAAAHGGEVTSLCLVPSITDIVNIPVIAAGGFADGRGLIAALSLGAGGVAMGSRFATSKESPLHQHVKNTVVEKDVEQTIYSKNFDGLYARVMKTPMAEKATRRPMNFVMATVKSFKAAKMVDMPLWKLLLGLLSQFDKIKMLSLFGAATEKLEAATIHGDLEHGVQFIGQSQGVIRNIESVQTLMDNIMVEAKDIASRNRHYFEQ
ncbi:NAD(P)H-dependent flavin oxidoreductase [Pseudoalteromonas piscicida]|uniref:Enoyl-ACP reductase n=1 Tax=Pseudoalteromonas piscicida TaxID=43662 RepID=A0A2A5JQJ5_PSEO7|nr:nitronate monooxygenase [Pseudoalteromonas piscicida]PCK31732.1 enoyl-ACP reductase [Pseudoalteromonas piscicida]